MPPLLEQKPVHVRKNIALGITIGFAVLLLGVMVLVYSTPKKIENSGGPSTKIGQFYATILESAQSYFGGDRAIISK